jgi:hypothetical protein
VTYVLRTLTLALAYCLVAASLAQSADAGTYTVSTCHFRDGRLASVDGWRVVQPQVGAQYDLSCADGTGLGVSVTRTRTYPRGFLAGIELRVPPDLRVSEFASQARLWTSGTSTWTWESGYWGEVAGTTGWARVDVCTGTGCVGGAFFDWRTIIREPDLQSVALAVHCSIYESSSCPSGTVAAAQASGIELTLTDAYQPRFKTPPAGTLLDRHTATRVRNLRYDVSDRGGGVRQVALEIDGVVAQKAAVDTATANCRQPYDAVVPCPLTASGSFTVDTSSWTPGRHVGRLLVFDASDGAPLEHRFEFWVTDPARPGESCAPDRSADIRLSPNPIRYGQQRVGFLATGLAGLPDQAAVIDAQTRSSVIGTAKLTDGKYVARMAIDRPRLLQIAFPLADGTFVCSQTVQLDVRAGLRLSIAPDMVSNGDTIHLHGRLFGGEIAGHRAVEIQARARGGPRRWTLVRVVQTTSRGRFKMNYTFRRTFQRVRYEFRAVRRGGDGFPYKFGTSKARMVLVRGS